MPVQLHAMDGDEWVEIDVLEALAREIPEAELFLYPGTAHLFADSSLGGYDEEAAALLLRRTLVLLESLS